jgi:ubiquinone/menaquinone biosynthesis C-methylase UbiE
MMELARGEYNDTNFLEFVQADITSAPFKEGAFDCVITLGLMHRLPENIRIQALSEIVRLSGRFLIISYSVKNRGERAKHWLLKKIWPSYKPAPSLISMEDLIEEIEANGLSVRKTYSVMPFFSAEIVFLMEKTFMSRRRNVL